MAASASSTSATRAGWCSSSSTPNTPGAAAVAHDVRVEFVLRAEGGVVARAPEVVNPNLATGEIEVAVDTLEVVSRCPPLPFQLDEEGVDETLRIRYRWLDLRRERLQRNIRTRARLVSIIRQEMEAAAFVDVETPIMAKPTPEARATSSSRPAFSAAASSPCRSRRRSTSSCSRSRARALLPDRALLPGRGPPRRPAAGADAARRGDGVPRPRDPLRARGAHGRAHLARAREVELTFPSSA